MMSNYLCLLAADCRQALFDAIKGDSGASTATRYEIGRAIQLMALMSDEIAALKSPAPTTTPASAL